MAWMKMAKPRTSFRPISIHRVIPKRLAKPYIRLHLPYNVPANPLINPANPYFFPAASVHHI